MESNKKIITTKNKKRQERDKHLTKMRVPYLIRISAHIYLLDGQLLKHFQFLFAFLWHHFSLIKLYSI